MTRNTLVSLAVAGGLLAAAAYALKNLMLQGGVLDGRAGLAFHREHMRYAALKYRLLRLASRG